ncbi:sulfurtransferase TusA family protein [Salipaludibacillus sp. CUR1]|uniref:TusA-related sulfurtransferase n=1 Tax=Salipaludibacillus aurantiacus TaxID=1601833 RepID=A0A1H9V0S8_9BACI|nr:MULTISPECIES: sulfurtransferase TusA family protein [Salipaludibacillus]MCE7793964.1 sulfurtransferase TusA family protein [Salipaludibacillus sp. CUR1]SES15228.1 TusA-related sulfurtransferase [Salipaludibacillus aurantiacus]
MESTKILDAKGLACPMPVVKVKKEMDQLNEGEILEVHVTDKGAKADLPAWAKSSGNELLQDAEEDGILKFWFKKA